jgi:hypothetical protein
MLRITAARTFAAAARLSFLSVREDNRFGILMRN